MKLFKNIQFSILVLFIIFISCTRINADEISIEYLGHDVYLKMNPNVDAELPPIYHLHFKIKNVSNETKVFIARSNSFDNKLSQLFLIDTLQKIKMPIYTGSIHIMKPNKEYDIDAAINIKDFKHYFKLSNDFFDNKIDFSNDKILLDRLLINMVNSSVINYKQDTSDVFQYRLLDKDVEKLKNENLILVKKSPQIKLN
ncbi:hypothetical protein CLU81_3290 [Flavobacterium sp. 9]|uniref:hypothetical protein n=1 Tax=Flavobacterium sp. 9 TaxID=2035198 RepID=UPI000C1891DA|nr:hypothetical protein [Flavobacterium sp. 9]PIF32736.1 hypothetical protein CLU81_3290 [Flavobacterium sp. 9]